MKNDLTICDSYDEPVLPRHTEDVQDIITTVPSWLLRWGITLFFVILVLLISLSALITYPDIVKARLEINSFNPPKLVTVKAPGNLNKLFVTQGQIVKAGQQLAVIETNINNDEISKKNQNPYTLISPASGKVSFWGIILENQEFNANQEIFFIVPLNERFFGKMLIPEEKVSKVREKQKVRIMVKAYPFEEYGTITGTITYISEVPTKDGRFISKVEFNAKKLNEVNSPIKLKQGMIADAEIITENATIMQRIGRSILKIVPK